MKFYVIVLFTMRHQRCQFIHVPLQPDSPHDHVVPHTMIFESSDEKFAFFTHTHTHTFLRTHTLAHTSTHAVLSHFMKSDKRQAQQGLPKPVPMAVDSGRQDDASGYLDRVKVTAARFTCSNLGADITLCECGCVWCVVAWWVGEYVEEGGRRQGGKGREKKHVSKKRTRLNEKRDSINRELG